jgi:preprotein translocase subunit SecE
MAETTDKDAGSAKDASAPVVRRSRSPIQFYSEVVKEVKKVTWPTWKETYLTTIMVFIMVALTMVFFMVVDYVLAYGEKLLIGV